MSWDIGKLTVAEGVPATLIPRGDLTPSVQLTAGSEARVAPCPEGPPSVPGKSARREGRPLAPRPPAAHPGNSRRSAARMSSEEMEVEDVPMLDPEAVGKETGSPASLILK